ncbi:unnamed protein product [Camellia sinensis]
MNRLPEWLTRLWQQWDVRGLALLSFTLQFILFVFGQRRKYTPSLWTGVIVWIAYLTADFVATLALSKLSDKGNAKPNGELGAIWAPLLLLHLGGPDTITAFSVEDNNLWLRHFIGLGVQTVVAVYVIILSWRNSLLSFLSIPAFVAGIIKYGERTWVLKSVSNDKSGSILPIYDHISIGSIHDPHLDNYYAREKQYVSALLLGLKSVKDFKEYMEQYEPDKTTFMIHHCVGDEIFLWKALEAEMGLMYDLWYTKAVVTYTKVGCIFRSISFACTVCVLVGYFWLTFRNQQHYYSTVDIAITGVLVVGALTLEIYAVALLLFSEWTILWLIKNKHLQLGARLGKRFPWLFRMLEKKRWSKKMGQFDLLGFCLKKQFKPLMTLTTWSRSRLEWLAGILDNVNWYMHKTCVNVQSDSKLPSMILRHIKYLADKNTIMRHHNTSSATKLKKLNDEEGDMTYSAEVHFHSKIFVWHIATEMCYHWDSNTCQSSCTNSTSADGDDGQASIKETCRTLSHYMMYLLLICPSMLGVSVRREFGYPGHSSDSHRIQLINDLQEFLKSKNVHNVSEACRALEDLPLTFDSTTREAREFALELKEKKMEERWEILSTMWLTMICYAAMKVQKDNHLQLLRQGGDLLTLVWFSLPQIVQPGDDNRFDKHHFNGGFWRGGNYFEDIIAIERNLIKQLAVLFRETSERFDKSEALLFQESTETD